MKQLIMFRKNNSNRQKCKVCIEIYYSECYCVIGGAVFVIPPQIPKKFFTMRLRIANQGLDIQE